MTQDPNLPTITQAKTTIAQTKVFKSSTKWSTLRTSIPSSVTSILQLKEGQQIIWGILAINDKTYITLKAGDKKLKT